MMSDVPLEVEDLRNRLKKIREFTDSAAQEGNIMDEIQARAMKQLRDAAFLVEDAIDEYMICEERQRPDPGCATLSCEIVDFIKTMILRYQIKCKFKDLDSQFREIKSSRGMVSKRKISSRRTKIPTIMKKCFQEAPPYMDEANSVGFEAPVRKSVFPVLKSTAPVLKSAFPVLKSAAPALKSAFEAPPYMYEADSVGFEAPVRKSVFPVLKSAAPVLKSAFEAPMDETDIVGFEAPVPKSADIVAFEAPSYMDEADIVAFETPPCMDEADIVGFEAPVPKSADIVAFEAPSYMDEADIVAFEAPPCMDEADIVGFEAPPYMDEADIVGFEAPSAKLIDWLLNGRQERVVVCVVGMTGIGKTILANTVYSNKKVISYFDYTVWILVSQVKTVEDLFRQLLYNIYKQKGDNLAQGVFQMDRLSLTIEVRNCLHQKRYAVFLDNICHTQFWSDIELALPDNMNGSRIFVTTTNMDVAVDCKRHLCVEVHEMQPLTLSKSLELFNKKTFFEFGGNCPENLKDVSLEIVKKCKGLPLAIVAIGSALSVKEKSSLQWKSFSENLHSEMIDNIDVSVITSLFCMDYDNLPSVLKPCLMYFAIYPEDYEIKSNQLIRQWIAEGFIEQKDGKTLEEVAEGYLDELINRCLVQKSHVSIRGKVKGCRIHDLSFVILRRKAKDLSFCKFVTDHDKSVNGIIRRLSIATTSNDLIENFESSHVRSLLFFAEDELPESLVKGIPTKYKILKVLDFENARLLDVPENVGDLIQLKYLSFRNTNIPSIPKSIGKLQNLETLDLRQTNVNELPKEISKLSMLRHLLGNKMSLIHLKGSIGGMKSLKTLSEVKMDEDGIELITELGKLTQLKKLSLFDVREEQGIALCSSINEMQHLEKLYIEAKSKDATIDLSFVSCPTMLQKLRLKAKLNKLPEWIPQLENLVELSMSNSQLTEDPLESLQDLPNLLVLNLLVRSYEGESLHFEGGFQKLKELGLRYLSNVESIIIEQGALPSLKELTFMKIPNLKMAPSGINHLKNLEVLNTHFMPTEFEKSIAPLAKLIKKIK